MSAPNAAARATAERIQILAEHLANADSDLRTEQIGDEIGDALRGLSGPDRDEFVRTLRVQFGILEQPAQRPGAPEPADAGDPGQIPLSHGIRAMLGMPADAACTPHELLGVTETCIRTLLAVASITDGTWAHVNGSSQTGESSDRAIRRALSGTGTDGVTALEAQLSAMQRLNAALLSALSQAGRLAHQQRASLAPEQIESFTRAEKRALGSADAACWKKYKSLASRLDEAGTEAEMRREIAEFVKSMASHSA